MSEKTIEMEFLAFIVIASIVLLYTILYQGIVLHQDNLLFNYTIREQVIANISTELSQFFVNMRFNHNNISYFIEESCDNRKQQNMKSAFKIISDRVKILSFYQTNDINISDIEVICSEKKSEAHKGEGVTVAGEGGPYKIVNGTVYPVIIKGKILLFNSSYCEMPIVEIHEIFHVFGFEHVSDEDDIMYPYANCRQSNIYDYTDYLILLYSIPALPELLFKSAQINQSKNYVNFEVFVFNSGIKDSENISLEISSENKTIVNFSLGSLKFGEGKLFSVQNLKLAYKPSEIIFELKSSSEEYEKDNNLLVAEVIEVKSSE